MQQDYQRALDAYDDAKMSLDAVTKPDEIRHVTEILEDGRYAVACVKARIAGAAAAGQAAAVLLQPRPRALVAATSTGPRPVASPASVPACPADAERVLAGADPYIRTVQVGAQRVPYWEGGQAYAPWAQGYYSRWSGSDMLSGVLIGSFLFGGMGNMFGGIGDGVGGIGDGIGEIGSGIGEGLGDIGGGIGDMFGDMFD